MPDLGFLAWAISGGPSSVTPVDAVTTSALGYWLSFGAIGIIAVALFWLYVWPGPIPKRIREEARADLLEENKRLRDTVDLLQQTVKEKDKGLEAAGDRADAAVRASELIADAFTEARHRRSGGRAGTAHGT